uniref:G domain-containing protein n=1 Tax=Tetraodon nigroviridis TaxID=99883 RepID=H3DQD2_TETNG
WRNNKENLDYVKSYAPKHPEVQHLRILLHGPVGAGKSSFINSVDTVLHGELRGRVLTDGNLAEGSFTKIYKNFRFTQESDRNSRYCFSINDIAGLEDSQGVHVDDVILALKGHVKDGYKFNPSCPLRERDEGYNPSPTPQDRVHVLVSVLPANNQVLLTEKMKKKMREIRNMASELG